MNGQINGSREKCVFNFFREKTFALNLVEAQMLDGVTFRFNNLYDGIDTDVAQFLLNKMSLPKSKVATTRANDDGIFHEEIFVRK